jgi:hypothetical protein
MDVLLRICRFVKITILMERELDVKPNLFLKEIQLLFHCLMMIGS